MQSLPVCVCSNPFHSESSRSLLAASLTSPSAATRSSTCVPLTPLPSSAAVGFLLRWVVLLFHQMPSLLLSKCFLPTLWVPGPPAPSLPAAHSTHAVVTVKLLSFTQRFLSLRLSSAPASLAFLCMFLCFIATSLRVLCPRGLCCILLARVHVCLGSLHSFSAARLYRQSTVLWFGLCFIALPAAWPFFLSIPQCTCFGLRVGSHKSLFSFKAIAAHVPEASGLTWCCPALCCVDFLHSNVHFWLVLPGSFFLPIMLQFVHFVVWCTGKVCPAQWAMFPTPSAFSSSKRLIFLQFRGARLWFPSPCWAIGLWCSQVH